MRVDCDVYAGLTRLLAEGTEITSGILYSLKSRNILQIEVRPDSILAQAPQLTAKLQPEFNKTQLLLRDADAIFAQHGIKLAVDPELLVQGEHLIQDVFAGIRQSGGIDAERLQPFAGEVVRQLSESPGHAVKLLDIFSTSLYLHRHSINVALFFLSLAKDWYASPEELEQLVMGALLHDAGLARVDEQVLSRPGPLTEVEWEAVREHPQWGEKLVKPVLPEGPVRSIVSGHHERLDGSGYPWQKQGVAIDRLARLASVCDVYDSLTSVRPYKPRLNFSRAIDIVVHGAGTEFDPALVHLFIRKTGRFPIGTFVQLSNGQIGAVKRINSDALWRPVVAVVMDSAGKLTPPAEELDLRKAPEIFILGILDENSAKTA